MQIVRSWIQVAEMCVIIFVISGFLQVCILELCVSGITSHRYGGCYDLEQCNDSVSILI